MSHSSKKHPVVLSIGILASNEEGSIQATLESLFRQSVFERLCVRHEQCEILVLANGCTDGTAAVARGVFDRMERQHDWSDGFTARVIDFPEAGKANAWNRFVHEFSAVEARFLVSMDADIGFHHRDTVFNLMAVLERKPHVSGSTCRQCKSLLFKERRTLRERLTLALSTLDRNERGSLCGQLYCLRATVARNIFLPRDLDAGEEDLINEVVRTEFLTRMAEPHRIVMAREAAHICDTDARLRGCMRRQKRCLMGRTAVHVLLSHLRTLPWQEQVNFGETLRRLEARDPDWLKKLIAAHLRHRPFFWQLLPGALTARFKQLFALPGVRKLTQAPAALAGWCITLVACLQASRTLRASTTAFWPKADGSTLFSVPQFGAK